MLLLLLMLNPCIDLDFDGVCFPQDCDDSNPEVYYLQDFYLDEDHDGYGSIYMSTFCWGREGYYIYPRDERSFNNLDCHDLDENINPGMKEIPFNNVDENCDGIIAFPPRSHYSMKME